jgi:hypothetical protein
MLYDMAEEQAPAPHRGRTLAEVLDSLRTPRSPAGEGLRAAAAAAAGTGGSLSELLNSLKPPVLPPIAVPELPSSLVDIDFSQMPEARTARAAEEMVDRLAEYQEQVAALVAGLQAQADEQRERAERAEAREHAADERARKMHRLTQASVAVAFLALLANALTPLLG